MNDLGPLPGLDDDEDDGSVKQLSSRQRARRAAMQACYQSLQSKTDSGDLVLQFTRAGHLKGADKGYFRKLVRGTLDEQARITALFSPHLDRPAEQLDPVEHAVLLVASYELADRVEVPFRVVLNEALEIAHDFGAEDGHRFINGVLDKVAQDVRATEVAARRGR